MGLSELDADLPADRRAELRLDVSVMRELGVLRWGDIVLGVEPYDPTTPSPAPQLPTTQPSSSVYPFARRASGGPVKSLGRPNQ